MTATKKAKTERVPSAAEIAARKRGMKGSAELREQFAIVEDLPRELVKVESLPTPPATELEAPARQRGFQPQAPLDIDQAVMTIFREEAEEMSVRLGRFGISFPPALQQDVVDHCYALLSMSSHGVQVGGGAVARR